MAGVADAANPVGPMFSASDVASPGFIPDSADFDGDNDIDGSDWLAWQRGFGTLDAHKRDGDADNDADADAADLLIWQAAYGQVAAAGTFAAAGQGGIEYSSLGMAVAYALLESTSNSNSLRAEPGLAGQQVDLAEADRELAVDQVFAELLAAELRGDPVDSLLVDALLAGAESPTAERWLADVAIQPNISTTAVPTTR